MSKYLSIALVLLLTMSLSACSMDSPTATDSPSSTQQGHPTNASSKEATEIPTPEPTPEPPSIELLYRKTRLPFGTPASEVLSIRGEPLPSPTSAEEDTGKKKKKGKSKSTPTPEPEITPGVAGIAFPFKDFEILPGLSLSEQRLIVRNLTLSGSTPDGVAQLEYEIDLPDSEGIMEQALEIINDLCDKEPDALYSSNGVHAQYHLPDFFVEFFIVPNDNGSSEGADLALLSYDAAKGTPDEKGDEPVQNSPAEAAGYLASLLLYPANYEEASEQEIMTKLNDVPIPAQESHIENWLTESGVQLKYESKHVKEFKGDPISKSNRTYVYPGVDIFDISPDDHSLEILFNKGDEVIEIRYIGSISPQAEVNAAEKAQSLASYVASICGQPMEMNQSEPGQAYSWDAFWRTTRFDISFEVKVSESQTINYKMVINSKNYVKKKG